jgi:hypothetical protein
MKEYRYKEEGLCIFEDAVCFMNPPYSNPRPFIKKAWGDSKYCKIVCLVKVDPSTRWWATFWDYKRCLVKCPEHLCRDGWAPTWDGGFRMCDNKECHDGYIRKDKAGSKLGCEVLFFPKRIKFDPPKGFEGKTSGPSFASCLVIMNRRGVV